MPIRAPLLPTPTESGMNMQLEYVTDNIINHSDLPHHASKHTRHDIDEQPLRSAVDQI